MRKPHVNAKIQWIPTLEGGRHSPVSTGYRGQFHLHGGEDVADVEWFLGETSVAPGTRSSCQIWFARPDTHLPLIQVGDSFEVREGRRVVGRGEITSFIDDAAY